MKKLFIFLSFLLLSMFLLPSQKAEAKIWTKDLVDKVTLESGYKFSLCTVDLKVDVNSAKDAGFLTAPEKAFEANPDSYPCNKQSEEDILFANITLHFNQAQGGGSSQEKVIEFQNKLYSVDEYGDIFDPGFIDSSHAYTDLGGMDWFSNTPGMEAIRGTNLIQTDPNAKGAFVPQSTFVILHDSSGKFTTALFVFNNVAYKISNVISQVTTGTTLVDYTASATTQPAESTEPEVLASPSPTPTPIPTPVQTPGISSFDPLYIPENYYELNKTHITINGYGFQNGATAFLEGDYLLEGSPDRLEPDPNSSIKTYPLENIVNTLGTRIDADLPQGLPNSYFKVKVVNPNGSVLYSTGTMALLRGGDPNEK